MKNLLLAFTVIFCVKSEGVSFVDHNDSSLKISILDLEDPHIGNRQSQEHQFSNTTLHIYHPHVNLSFSHESIWFLQDFLTRTLLAVKDVVENNKPATEEQLIQTDNTTRDSLMSGDESGRLCVLDLMEYSASLLNRSLWALKMSDATGKAGPGLLKGNFQLYGDYDECLGVRGVVNRDIRHVIEGKYCLAFLRAPKGVTEMVTIPTIRMAQVFPEVIEWHICVPKSCNGRNVTAFLKTLSLGDMSVLDVVCHEKRDVSHNKNAIAGIGMCCVFILLSSVGTFYGVIMSAKSSKKRCLHEPMYTIENINVYKREPVDKDQSYGSVHIKRSFTQNILMSFSLVENAKKLLNIKCKRSELSCIHGIRVLSMAWVILGHTMYMASTIVVNPTDLYHSLHTFTMQAVINGSLAVDTFFLLSGCLASLIFLREKELRGHITCGQMVLYYTHRFWRLTPLYMMVILVYVCLTVSDGPKSVLLSTESCKRNWWVNLLYINNIYKNTPADICLGQSWFLSADMQFHWIAPLVLVPIACGWVFIGFLVIFGLLCVHITSYTVLEYKFGGNVLDYQTKVYVVPYCRVGVYAIGLGLGYILNKTKCKFRISRVWQLFGWSLAIGLGLTSTYVTFDQWSDGRNTWNRSAAVAHEVMFRPAWALAVSWVIFTCCCGQGGVVNSVLSWSAWKPLGKLTYGTFLLHTLVLFSIWSSSRTPQYYSIHSTAYNFIVIWVISYGLSFLFSIFVESPCLEIEKHIMKKVP